MYVIRYQLSADVARYHGRTTPVAKKSQATKYASEGEAREALDLLARVKGFSRAILERATVERA